MLWEEPEEALIMVRMRAIVRRYRVLIGLLSLAGFAAGAGVAAMQAPVYHATATVYVSSTAVTSTSGPEGGTTYVGEVTRSYVDLATSPSLLHAVIQQLGLHTTDAALAAQVRAGADDGTVLIRVGVDDVSPERAAAIANAVVAGLGVAGQQLTPSGERAVTITPLESALVPTEPVQQGAAVALALGTLAGLLAAAVVVAIRR
jgi:non-specific protein-tyrosine kinase